MNYFDNVVYNYFLNGRTSFFTEFFYTLTTLFDFGLLFVLIIFLACLVIYLIKGLKYSFLFFFSVFVGGTVSYLLKHLFDVARPIGGVASASGQSFPSSHATISTVFFLMLIYTLGGYFTGFWKKLFKALCLVGIILISLSRLYLGVHWLSDVLFGVFLGCIISYLCVLLFNRVRNVPLDTSMLK
jgi:undecaprenyl-diphosphatase